MSTTAIPSSLFATDDLREQAWRSITGNRSGDHESTPWQLLHGSKQLRFNLKQFLKATSAERRFTLTSEVATEILKISDMQENERMRQALLRLELEQGAQYHRQRDHTTHTLWNYLLGFMIVENSTTIRRSLSKAIEKRFGSKDWGHYLTSLWPFVSLLHDIGYVLEGDLSQAEHGRWPLKDRCWRLVQFFDVELPAVWGGIAPREFQDICHEVGVSPLIELPMSEPHKIVASLREMPLGHSLRKLASIPDTTNTDAFSLWAFQYTEYSQHVATKRIKHTATRFETDAISGVKYGTGTSVKTLNHGVVSALLLLRASTLYYSIVAHLREIENAGRKIPSCFNNFLNDLSSPSNDPNWADKNNTKYPASYWKNGILWATSACAVHDYAQQDAASERLDFNSEEDDALAYLGVLVDIIQEWDRPTFSSVGKYTDVQSAYLVDGADMKFQIDDLPVISYPSLPAHKKPSDKVVADLDKYLSNWKSVTTIQSHAL